MSAERGIRFLPSVAGLVLQSLGQHQLMTTRQVHVLHLPGVSLRYTQLVLAELQKAGLVNRACAAHGAALWFATPEGMLLLRSKSRLDAGRHHDEGMVGVLREHPLALNEIGVAFVRAARARGDECDAFSWRHEVAHPLTDPCQGRKREWLVADALLTYSEWHDGGPVLRQRFVELDFARSPAARFAAKLSAYKLLRHCQSPAERPGEPTEFTWRRHYREFPGVLVVLIDLVAADARRRIENVIALWRYDRATRGLAAVPLHFVMLEQLLSDGPYAPIFTSADEPERPVNWLGKTGPGRSEMHWPLGMPRDQHS